MGDDTRTNSNRPQRHTAKSDQRFDAGRRVIMSTFKVDKARDEANHNEDNKKRKDESEKEDKIDDDMDRNRLHPKDEMKILKHWGLLKKTLNIAQIIDPLIEKGVITPERWMKLKRNQKTDQDTVEEFLYFLLKSHHDAYEIFLKSLKSREYGHVANQLERTGADDTSPPVSLSSEGSNQNNRHIGRPTTINRIFPRQSAPVIPDPRNGANEGDRNVSAAQTVLAEHGAISANTRSNTVKPEDLHRMKEEITGELRELRANIEKDRDEDRLELCILQRKHSELQGDLAKTKGDREQLKAELTFVTETVKVLKAQIELKQSEYNQVKDKNQDLEKKLENRSGHLEKLIREKEREKSDLVKTLKTKEGEYKQLQSMLERLKEEHEDRHARLKGLTKDKVTLEKEVQLLNKEKKNLEVKIKSLEQHIRVLQETHARETGDIKQELLKQKTLLEEKEKERLDLEKKLQESVRENENLKKTNHDLVESLQKTKDEKAHLQEKLHKADMTKYVLPPFLAGSRSTRTGWNPKNLRR
ncbi:cingulin-like protein 1 [Mercenaria mercenaria]|uniref:cingulin-like protein 1 n=1 Tax=Mercenaria mercenaria TaxID=6596 RepID=UPI00234F8259|nr:cingulin-like protein 1 [Mercenaria mercenaria]